MSYLGLLEAVATRIKGRGLVASLDTKTLLDRLSLGETVTVGNTEVPIFFSDDAGQLTKSAHQFIAYDVISMTPRFDEAALFRSETYGNSEAKCPVPASLQLVDGELVVGQVEASGIATPFNLLVALTVRSKDPVTSGVLVQHLYDVFRPRDFIEVPMWDGTTRTWDMIFQDFTDLDAREAVLSGTPGVERSYKKTLTVLVEGFLDKTSTLRVANLVREQIVALRLAEKGTG